MKNKNEDSITNGAKKIIETGLPYRVNFKIKGTADLLFHRWDCDAVEAKAKASKNSKAKKTDDLETFLYRDKETKEMCLPSEYIRQSLIYAAKFKPDPRSPRKSMMDLAKASFFFLKEYVPLENIKDKTKWDYENKKRVVIQRGSAISRIRPAFSAGWEASFIFEICLPEYIDSDLFLDLLSTAGRMIGVGDFRPTYGRFNVISYEVLDS